jgi:hypothetical protein
MAVQIERVACYGWPNCYRIANGDVELIITSDVGPRIMRYAFPDQPNLFVEFPHQLGKSGEAVWVPRGGSRIWMAPEDRVRTYTADNVPVRIRIDGDELTAITPVEPESGLSKEITVRIAVSGTRVEVVHRLTNALDRTQRVAAWVLAMMAPGGMGITGFPPRGTHPEVLEPSNPLVMWAFTDLSDPRWRFLKKYLLLKQELGNAVPQKLGHFNKHTWGAYLLGETLFLKQYHADPNAAYPDFGCSYETFTNADVLELETLGPLVDLAPGQTLEHTEHWSLHSNVRVEEWTDECLDRTLLPLLAGPGPVARGVTEPRP